MEHAVFFISSALRDLVLNMVLTSSERNGAQRHCSPGARKHVMLASKSCDFDFYFLISQHCLKTLGPNLVTVILPRFQIFHHLILLCFLGIFTPIFGPFESMTYFNELLGSIQGITNI